MNDYIDRIDNYIRPLGSCCKLARVGGSVRDEILGRRIKDADYVAFGIGLDTLGRTLRRLFPDGKVSSLSLRDGRQAGWRLFQKGYGIIEIMLPRTEISTGPGHRDFKIVLDLNLTPEQDAQRRDFTFNALYKVINPATHTTEIMDDGSGRHLVNILDPTGRGLYDLQHKLIHTTHPDSFRDDPLRILRALRFVSVLGYDLSTDARNEMIEHAEAAHGLSQVYKHEASTASGAVSLKCKCCGSQNAHKQDCNSTTMAPVTAKTEAASGTVLDEMSKLLMGDDVGKALRLMRDTGVLKIVLPELAAIIGHSPNSRYHDLNTDEHTFVALEAAAKAGAPLVVRWALLFHDAGKPIMEWMGTDGRTHYYAYKGSDPDATSAMREDHEYVSERLWRQACKRLNVPKDLREGAALLIREHMVKLQPKNPAVKIRRMRVKFGDEMLENLLLHRACDCMGKQKSAESQLKHIAVLVAHLEAARGANVPASVKDLKIGGKDMIEMGLKGRRIGEVLAAVLDEVVCQPDDLRRQRDWQLTAALRLS